MKDYLDPFLDKDKTPWQMRLLGGHRLEMNATHMAQLNYAYLFQRMFFNEQSKQPNVDFSLRLLTLSPLLSHIAIQMGEQDTLFQSNRNATVKRLHWPDARSKKSMILSYVALDGREYHWELNGEWAFFKFLDQAQIIPTDDPKHFIVRFDESGKEVRLQLNAAKDLNPFIPEAIHRMSLPARLI